MSRLSDTIVYAQCQTPNYSQPFIFYKQLTVDKISGHLNYYKYLDSRFKVNTHKLHQQTHIRTNFICNTSHLSTSLFYTYTLITEKSLKKHSNSRSLQKCFHITNAFFPNEVCLELELNVIIYITSTNKCSSSHNVNLQRDNLMSIFKLKTQLDSN